MYADFPAEPDSGFRDYHVFVENVDGPRRWLRPQVQFRLDGEVPFKPLAEAHAFALLEWGMNWCIAGQAHHFLLLHAAVLERLGRAVILPGEPGAGKSTLTAALMLSGWRLLSDELAVVDRDDGLLCALARPVSLKNRSIEIIRGFSSSAIMSDVAVDTHKGTVAHLRASRESVRRMHEKAVPAHVVFPRWVSEAPLTMRNRPKADAFMYLASHAFNYSLLGRQGFELNASLIDRCECWDLEYSDLEQVLRTFDELSA